MATLYTNIFDYNSAGFESSTYDSERAAREGAEDFAERYSHSYIDDGKTVKRVNLLTEDTAERIQCERDQGAYFDDKRSAA